MEVEDWWALSLKSVGGEDGIGRAYIYIFPLPFMVVGLRDEAQNRKCPVSRTLVTPHVPAHDRAFRGLGSSASTERILTLSFTCASPCCPLSGTQRINPGSPCLTSPLLNDLGSFVALSHYMSMLSSVSSSRVSRIVYISNLSEVVT